MKYRPQIRLRWSYSSFSPTSKLYLCILLLVAALELTMHHSVTGLDLIWSVWFSKICMTQTLFASNSWNRLGRANIFWFISTLNYVLRARQCHCATPRHITLPAPLFYTKRMQLCFTLLLALFIKSLCFIASPHNNALLCLCTEWSLYFSSRATEIEYFVLLWSIFSATIYSCIFTFRVIKSLIKKCYKKMANTHKIFFT